MPLPIVSEADVKREEQRASLYDVMEMATAFFVDALQSSQGAKARGYLADRGLVAAIQKDFALGYAPDDRSALRNHLAEKNVTVQQMAEAGLVVAGDDVPVAYDRFRDRVIFPIRDARGRVIAFGGRALKADAMAKYLNSPETPLFHKGDVLYNFDKARGASHASGEIVAVEGYVDVIAMVQAGITHAVAPLGTALTENQLKIMWKSAPEPTLCFDGDSAGQKAAYRALDLALPLLQSGRSLKFAFLPEGQDPDDLLKAEGPDAVKKVVAEALPMAEVLWRRQLGLNDRATPERKALFERDYRNLINQIAEDGVKRHYLADMQERLNVLFGRNAQRSTGGTRFQPRLKFGQKPWEQQLPVSQKLKSLAQKTSVTGGAEGRAAMIVWTLINHPQLLHEFWTEFAAVELANRELDSLRTQILDSVSSEERLETAVLRGHLVVKGYGPLLDRLESQAKLLNEWQSSPAAAFEDARTGLRQMIALHHKAITLDREVRAAEAAFAHDPTEENLNALDALLQQYHSTLGSEALIDGFGAASGRESTVIT